MDSEQTDTSTAIAADVTSSLQSTLSDIASTFVDHLPFLIAGFIVLALTWVAVKVFSKVSHRLFRGSDLRNSLQQLIIRLASIGIWFLGIMIAATLWFPGMTPASLLGGLGLLSVAVGFAFQDIFENFFAGILLLWRFPFEQGDYIECEGIEGQVDEISVRMTQIRQTSGELVLVPNSLLFKNPVEILTNLPKRRASILCGVAYDEDLEECVPLIEEAVSQCETVDTEQHPVQIFPKAFGSSSIDIEVTWWTDSTPVGIRKSVAEVVTAIKRTLDQADIEIPFPYRTLTFKQPLQVAEPATE